ncbi:MAG TPA: response regulator [Chloroflexota bacterium]|nr:response regulator [Chloroflexota bacterium]
MIVDDDSSIREFVSMALSFEGYHPITANDGAAALELLETEDPRVILLDMRMPGVDGWAFARRYRAKPGPRAPIIVLTAARDAADFAREIDADGFLPKPFNLDELLTLVGKHVQAR